MSILLRHPDTGDWFVRLVPGGLLTTKYTERATVFADDDLNRINILTQVRWVPVPLFGLKETRDQELPACPLPILTTESVPSATPYPNAHPVS